MQRETKTNSIYGYSQFCLDGGEDVEACGFFNFNEYLSSDRSFIGTTPDGMFFFISNLIDFNNAIVVDVNGLKSPNKIGRDIFGFRYFDYNNSVIVEPVWSMKAAKFERGEEVSYEELQSWVNENCDPKSTSSEDIYPGATCGAKIIMDGWKMNY